MNAKIHVVFRLSPHIGFIKFVAVWFWNASKQKMFFTVNKVRIECPKILP